jgi:heterodisulfide reductase subunit A-like polyferredoxin
MIYEKQKRYIIPFDDVPTPRAEMPEISVEERRGNFAEVETGFPEQVAVNEAKRCLSCRRCLGCALCWAECGPEAIDFSIPDEELNLEFDEVVITRGQDNAFYPIPSNLGFGTYADVITDLQFERMLSPTGPTDGLVVSPLHGDIPRRLAIIQGNPVKDDDAILPSLILGVNESIIALNRAQRLEVVLIAPLSDGFKGKFLPEAEQVRGLRIVDGLPDSVERTTEGAPLTLRYSENGRQLEEAFDLVVVLTRPKIPSELVSLSKKLGVDVL